MCIAHQLLLGRRVWRTLYGSPNVTIRYGAACPERSRRDGDRIVAECNGSGTLLRKFIYGPGIDEPICLIDGKLGRTRYRDFGLKMQLIARAGRLFVGPSDTTDMYVGPQGATDRMQKEDTLEGKSENGMRSYGYAVIGANNGNPVPKPETAAVLPGVLVLFGFYYIIGLSGYGNDTDTYRMIRQGQELLSSLKYYPSRPPGYFVPEVIIGLTSRLGGYFLSNLLSALMGSLVIYMFYGLIRKYFDKRVSTLVALIVAFNPFYVIAASSTMDYVYSLFFGFCGVLCLDRRRPFWAAPLFALSLSSRLLNSLIVFGIYVGFLIDYYKQDGRRASLVLLLSALLALSITAALYVPSYVAFGYSFGFMTYGIGDWDWFGHLARFVYRNMCVLGVLGSLFVMFTSVWGAVVHRREWLKVDPLVKLVAFFIFGMHEMLFLKMPPSVPYLLPLLFLVIPVWAAVIRKSTVLLLICLFLTLSYNVFKVDVLKIEYKWPKHEAVSARVAFSPGYGVLVEDLVQRAQSQGSGDSVPRTTQVNKRP